jgi:hypothetical protein
MLFPVAAVMQITGTLYLLWLGVSSASNGETKKATWTFIICFLYVVSTYWVWHKARSTNADQLAKQIDELRVSNQKQQQAWEKDRHELLEKINSLENPIPHAAVSAYSPGSREARVEQQWHSLTAGEKEAVRFILFNGTATILQLVNHLHKEGFAESVSVVNTVQAKSAFVLGNFNEPDAAFTINPEFRPDLLRLSR